MPLPARSSAIAATAVVAGSVGTACASRTCCAEWLPAPKPPLSCCASASQPSAFSTNGSSAAAGGVAGGGVTAARAAVASVAAVASAGARPRGMTQQYRTVPNAAAVGSPHRSDLIVGYLVFARGRDNAVGGEGSGDAPFPASGPPTARRPAMFPARRNSAAKHRSHGDHARGLAPGSAERALERDQRRSEAVASQTDAQPAVLEPEQCRR